MISSVREREIHQCALETVAKAAFNGLPVDPRKIAKDKDIELKPWKPTKAGISGFLMKQQDAFGIGYSTAIENEGFINFTIAHELGHYFLDGHVEALLQNGSGIHFSASGFVSNDIHEREADAFAAELLMPEPFFKAELRKSGSGFSAIERLSGLGHTSVVATAIRFAKLADDPLAAILSSGNQVEWCFLSPELKECRGVYQLGKKSFVPCGSPTGKFNRDGARVLAGGKVEGSCSLKDWFERAPDIEFQEDVVGLGHYGKTLTVLFTEEALDDKDMEDEGDDEDRGLPSSRWNQRY